MIGKSKKFFELVSLIGSKHALPSLLSPPWLTIDQGIRSILLGLKQGNRKAHISHLKFDDDALLSSAHNYIMLNKWCQERNIFKPLLVVLNIEGNEVTRISLDWGCVVDVWPLEYFGQGSDTKRKIKYKEDGIPTCLNEGVFLLLKLPYLVCLHTLYILPL